MKNEKKPLSSHIKNQLILCLGAAVTIAIITVISTFFYLLLRKAEIQENRSFLSAVVFGIALLFIIRIWATWSSFKDHKEESDGSTTSS